MKVKISPDSPTVNANDGLIKTPSGYRKARIRERVDAMANETAEPGTLCEVTLGSMTISSDD